MLHDPFGRSRLPVDYSRSGRVKLLGEAFRDLLEGRMPSDEARTFLAAGGLAWLEQGGDLLKDFWKIRGAQGSTHTPSVIWSSIDDSCSSGRATDIDDEGTMDPSDS